MLYVRGAPTLLTLCPCYSPLLAATFPSYPSALAWSATWTSAQSISGGILELVTAVDTVITVNAEYAMVQLIHKAALIGKYAGSPWRMTLRQKQRVRGDVRSRCRVLGGGGGWGGNGMMNVDTGGSGQLVVTI